MKFKKRELKNKRKQKGKIEKQIKQKKTNTKRDIIRKQKEENKEIKQS